MAEPLDPAKEVPCPFCSKAIPVIDVPWTCPSCGTTDKEWSLFASCAACAFAPYYFVCPCCGAEFELALLLGRYQTHEGATIPPERRPAFAGTRQTTLGELRVGIASDIREDKARLQDALDVLAHGQALELPSPCKLEAYFVLSAVDDSAGRTWLYGQLIADVTRPKDARVGHFSLLRAKRGASTELRVLEYFPEARQFM